MKHLKLFENFIESEILDIEDYLLELTDDGLLILAHEFMVSNDYGDSGNNTNPRISSLYHIITPDKINSIDQLEKLSILYKRLKGCLSRSSVKFQIIENGLTIYLEPKDGVKKLFNDFESTYISGFLYKFDNINLEVNFGKIHDDMSIEINVNGYSQKDVNLISESEDIQKSIIDKFTKDYGLKFVAMSNMTLVKKHFRFTS